MLTTIRCSACRQSFQAPAAHPATCPNCGAIFRPTRRVVPHPNDAAETPQNDTAAKSADSPDTRPAKRVKKTTPPAGTPCRATKDVPVNHHGATPEPRPRVDPSKPTADKPVAKPRPAQPPARGSTFTPGGGNCENEWFEVIEEPDIVIVVEPDVVVVEEPTRQRPIKATKTSANAATPMLSAQTKRQRPLSETKPAQESTQPAAKHAIFKTSQWHTCWAWAVVALTAVQFIYHLAGEIPRLARSNIGPIEWLIETATVGVCQIAFSILIVGLIRGRRLPGT